MPHDDDNSGGGDDGSSSQPTCPQCNSTLVTPVPAPPVTTASSAPPRMDIITQLMVDAIASALTSIPGNGPAPDANNDVVKDDAKKDS